MTNVMKKAAKYLIRFFALCMACGFCSAKSKETYHITLTIEGNNDTVMYMGHYYAAGNLVVDTAKRDRKGQFVFSGTKELKPGMYFFANPKGNYADFVVYHEKPFFKFKTIERNWTLNMEVEGSKENQLVYNYQRMIDNIYKEFENQRAGLDSATAANFYHTTIRSTIDSASRAFIKTNPNCMIAKVLMVSIPPEVPLLDDTGRELSNNERFYYMLDHYFDNIPLDDEMIIRTPKGVFYQHIMDYLDRALKGALPSDIIPRVDAMLDRCTPDGEVFQWLLLTCAQKYLQSNVMSYDEIYVHLILKYYANANWAEPSSIEQEVDRATKWDRLLIGREAPELIMFDTLRHAHSLHRMPSEYKLLVFWSPTCGHCKQTVPKLYSHFEHYADSLSLSVYAVLTEPDESTIKQWKNFLANNHIDNPLWVNLNGGETNIDWREVYDVQTTPQVYLLDGDNKILAKKLDGELFELVLKNLIKKK